MIHLLRTRATKQQLAEMLELLSVYIKLAVDIRQGILAGGGELHADCEAVLIEAGCRQEDIWGADWFPNKREIRFESLINVKSRQNRSMMIRELSIRRQVEQIVRNLLEGV
jgi:hypothetical protein